MATALVLLSGGQDSATCLALAIAEFGAAEVMTLSFDYGQRHRIELQKAQILAATAGVSYQEVALPFIGGLSHNALTDEAMVIDALRPESMPNTFVPGRNLFFLSVAAVVAKQHGIRILYTGVCQTDYSGYPDCRDTFVKSLNVTLNLAMEDHFEIRTPLMWMTKSETVLLMAEMGRLEWYGHTYTCYEGVVPPCGTCPSCLLRAKGFHEAGIFDPQFA
jgi:7-cyano-7-deazaguanine synthase